jgi:hypothetical protein
MDAKEVLTNNTTTVCRKRVSEKENEDLQDASGDVDELEQLFKAKEWENEKATYIEDTKESWLQRTSSAQCVCICIWCSKNNFSRRGYRIKGKR